MLIFYTPNNHNRLDINYMHNLRRKKIMNLPNAYISMREFLDNLPTQPCIWPPDNESICVTCLRINDNVAKKCTVWSDEDGNNTQD